MGKHSSPDNLLNERTKAMKQRLIQNTLISSGVTMLGVITSCGMWYYTVPSCVVFTVSAMAMCLLTIAITAVRELLRACERTLPRKKRKRIRVKYDSRGMHTDSQRLGYVSAETIREVCRR